MKTKPRNFGLDAVRAAAILLVLLSHGSKYLPGAWTQGAEDTYWSVGVLGVELFYALSGFLIGGILLRMQASGAGWRQIKNFMLRRWIRTLPLYFLILAALLAFPILDPNPHRETLSYLTLTQNFLAPMQSIWFGPSWSLTIEEWSYIALPLLAFGFFRHNKQAVLCSALVLVTLGLLWRFLFSSPFQPWDETVRKVVLTRIDAIAFGIVVVSLQHIHGAAKIRLWARRLAPFSLLAAASTFWICAIRATDMSYLQSFYGRVLMFTCDGTALAGLLPLVLDFRAPSSVKAPVQFIARISYALYLVHWPLLFILGGIPPALRFLVFLSGSFVVATLLSYGIEQPLLRLRPPLPQTPVLKA